MDKKIRVRFAPSPTGYLHVGGARSALFNYLFSRHHNGTFILRIEDTDRSRFVENAMKEIFESMKWLGLNWDEGPEVNGDYGPYEQSKRLDLYKKYAEKLLESGNAYRCFCSPQRLAELRTEQEKNKQNIGYDRHCLTLSEDQVAEKLKKGDPHVIRFKIPHGRIVSFEDSIRGRIEYKSEVLDDLVLLKADEFPTYHMANVIDDHLMEISHVLRGDEWIASTPRHILIYEAFGWEPPKFAHLPVILAPDGKKLSKRKGAASVMDYKQNGFLPEALFNYLALLGWSPGDDREKMSLEEMVKSFSLKQVSAKASVFDEKKLEWMNGLYMAERSALSLADIVVPEWKKKQWINSERSTHDQYLLDVIELMKVRSKRTTDLVENSVYFFKDPQTYEEKAARKYFKDNAAELLKEIYTELEQLQVFDKDHLEKLYHDFAQKSEISFGKIIHPARLAVSGVSFGPGLFELLSILGKEVVLRRIKTAVSFIERNRT